jgi:hypothetical protein
MVFMRNRRAEQRHDAIPHDLVDRPLVAVHGSHHALQHRVEEPPRFLGIAVGQQLHGAFEVCKQHGDLLALAFQDAFGGQDLLGKIRRGVGEWETVLATDWGSCRVGGGDLGTVPDQDTAFFIHRQALPLDEFGFQICQIRVIELELPLEGAIGQAPPALEHGYRLVEDLLKGHRPPSLCRCGVQKTVWEWEKPFERTYTAHG